MTIPHITLNTGHAAEIDLSVVDADTIRHFRALWPRGGQLPAPLGAYRVEFGGLPEAVSFSLWRAGEPLVIAAVCFDETLAEELWGFVERLYLDAAKHALAIGSECPERPPAPWLQVALMPPMMHATEGDIRLLGRMEQAVAAMVWRMRG